MEDSRADAPLFGEKRKIRPFSGPLEQTQTEKADVEDQASKQLTSSSVCDSDSEDIDLLRKASFGNGKAFHLLVDRHGKRLYRLAVWLVGNSVDAEDVVQEAFAGAFRGMARFEARASVKTWLTRILYVQAAKWRRDRRRRSMESVETNPGLPGISGTQSGVEHRIDLQAALHKLSPEHREVLVLREFEQMSYEEIAAVLEVPRGTVESRLHRARAELRDKLKAYTP